VGSGVETIVVGYLPAVRGEVAGRQGIGISGAATLAIETINNDSTLLPGVKLELVWNDTEVSRGRIRCLFKIGKRYKYDKIYLILNYTG